MTTHDTDRPLPTPAPRRRGARPRMLVVDDERSMRELLAIVLGARATRCCWRRTGAGRRSARARRRRPAHLGHPHARHDRHRGAARGQGDGPRHRRASWSPRSRRRRRRSRRMRLGACDYIDQAIRRRRAEGQGPATSSRAAGCGARTCCSSGRSARAPVLEHHRPQRRDARRCSSLIETIAQTTQHRADHGRVGHRQGAGRARHPLPLAAARSGRSSPSTAAR